jgi:hypothetical protein
MAKEFDRLLRRHGLESSKFEGAMAQRAMEVFKERTAGLLEVAWQLHGWQLENLQRVVEQYGFDCYHQGVMDGARVATDRPELREAIQLPVNGTEL